MNNMSSILSGITPIYSPWVKPSFEMTVAMAFKYFADSQVDIAVIEVGLGVDASIPRTLSLL